MKIQMAAALALALVACSRSEPVPQVSAPSPTPAAGATVADAQAFVDGVNADLKKMAPLNNAAQWVAVTYINDDGQLLASQATERFLEFQSRKVEESKKFNGLALPPDVARQILLLKLSTSMPAPSDPAKREELAKIAAGMEANYGAGKWCRPNSAGKEDCLSLTDIEKIVDDPKVPPAERAAAWAGWHATARPIRDDYQRFVELTNEGSKELGFANLAEMWKAGYDMSPAEFEQETERLWGQVKPLYEQLHCYVRDKLKAKYPDAMPADGTIPAHLLGNMWAQQWGTLYEDLAPHPGVGDLDVTGALKTMRDTEYKKLVAEFKGKPGSLELAEIEHQADAAISVKMTKIAEDFYVKSGFPSLPESFWQKSMLTKPRDRDVVCHASAWDMNMAGDVRIKQCVEPDADELDTIHHELGHVYYYLIYNQLPPLFQSGAHDGFHEAVGDTITLSLTPEHLMKIGLVRSVEKNEQATLNAQMKLALDKIAFLPFGKMIDQWRWRVFSGETKPADYNAAWWKVRRFYQGISEPVARAESDFDPGAKYHIPGNTPYTRYFLSFILQFQFQKALCAAAGHQGPLHECDIYNSPEAGKRFVEMLAMGQSRPWPDALEKLTGTRQMDGAAITEYFTPLMGWLQQQNQGKACGWTDTGVAPTPAPAPADAPATAPAPATTGT